MNSISEAVHSRVAMANQILSRNEIMTQRGISVPLEEVELVIVWVEYWWKIDLASFEGDFLVI